MMTYTILQTEPVRRILGQVEIATIMKKIQGRRLKQTERNYLSRSIRPKLIASALLSKSGVLEAINRTPEDSSIVESNLSYYGYPMFGKPAKGARIPLEQLIVMVLDSYPSARYIEAIPVLIIKNRIDPFRLLDLASNHGIRNKVGYLIETAMMLKPLPHLRQLHEYLKVNKDKRIQHLVEGDTSFLADTSPRRVLDWNLLGRFFDEDFRRSAEAYL
jgi:hypothetical protein